jgi:hypothetical protein
VRTILKKKKFLHNSFSLMPMSISGQKRLKSRFRHKFFTSSEVLFATFSSVDKPKGQGPPEVSGYERTQL